MIENKSSFSDLDCLLHYKTMIPSWTICIDCLANWSVYTGPGSFRITWWEYLPGSTHSAHIIHYRQCSTDLLLMLVWKKFLSAFWNVYKSNTTPPLFQQFCLREQKQTKINENCSLTQTFLDFILNMQIAW